MKINYKSDFKLEERIVGENIDAPFRFKYYVRGSNEILLTASYTNGIYINCRRTPEGSILIAFDNLNKTIGLLYVNREYFLTDADYKDGICNLITDDYTGIELVSGKSDGTYASINVYPNYQKGDTGKTAYESAVELGFVGTEEEWIASIKQPSLDAAQIANEATFSANVAASNANSAKVNADVAAANATTSANEADDARIQLTSEVDQAILSLTEIIRSSDTTDVTDYPDVFN